jgi:hypothetical protein
VLHYLSWISIAEQRSTLALVMDGCETHNSALVRDKTDNLRTEVAHVPRV